MSVCQGMSVLRHVTLVDKEIVAHTWDLLSRGEA